MNPHYGCDNLNPICKPPDSETTEAQCVCTNDANQCEITVSTICTASGSAATPVDGECTCGNAVPSCDPTSPTPSCLRTSNGTVPDVGATAVSCQVYLIL